MKFLEFKEILHSLPGFTLNDIRKIDPEFYRQQLIIG